MSGKKLLAQVQTIPQTTIIFYLTGVLFHPSKKFLLCEVGILNVLTYAITNLKSSFAIFKTALLMLLYEIVRFIFYQILKKKLLLLCNKYTLIFLISLMA